MTPFPRFPTMTRENFSLSVQKEYKQFVESLSLRLVASFDNRLYIYELPTESVTPRIYISNNTIVLSRAVEDMSVPLSLLNGEGAASVFLMDPKRHHPHRRFGIRPNHKSTLLRMIKNPNPPRIMHHAFATQPPSSFLYPLVVLKRIFFYTNAAITIIAIFLTSGYFYPPSASLSWNSGAGLCRCWRLCARWRI